VKQAANGLRSLVSVGLSASEAIANLRVLSMTKNNVDQPESFSITSRKIAKLTGKCHKAVKRDIKRMIDELNEIEESDHAYTLNVKIYIDKHGRDRSLYIIDYDTALCLANGYDPVSRAVIIKYLRDHDITDSGSENDPEKAGNRKHPAVDPLIDVMNDVIMIIVNRIEQINRATADWE
jgi:hypothetical protein